MQHVVVGIVSCLLILIFVIVIVAVVVVACLSFLFRFACHLQSNQATVDCRPLGCYLDFWFYITFGIVLLVVI
jgi:uncharacterized metal-binding protein